MNREITDIYKKDFFSGLRKTDFTNKAAARGLDIDDVSEMTGMSKIKIKSIEKGCEERLLRLPLSCLLNICYALDKKLVISLQDMPTEKGIDKLLPA